MLTMKTVYKPVNHVDTFHFGVKQGVCLCLAQASLPRELMQPLFQLGFIYSPLVLVVTTNLQAIDDRSYAIAKQDKIVDLDWVLEALSRFEQGWTIDDNVLYSPVPSALSEGAIIGTLKSAVPAETKEHVVV